MKYFPGNRQCMASHYIIWSRNNKTSESHWQNGSCFKTLLKPFAWNFMKTCRATRSGQSCDMQSLRALESYLHATGFKILSVVLLSVQVFFIKQAPCVYIIAVMGPCHKPFDSLWPSDAIWVNNGSGIGLLPHGTKPLPEPMVAYH